MRVVSWTVVFGAVSALVYTGFKPFIQDLEFSDVGADQVRGTIVAPRRAAERDGKQGESENTPDLAQRSCDEEGEDRAESDCADTPR